MGLVITILWILVLLSLLVILHEGGHFLAAKLVGVHVEEFGLGYPPRVRILFTKWKTRFSLNMIPLGGFVRLYGDDAETFEQAGDTKSSKEIQPHEKLPAGVTKANAFSEKSIAARMTIILAGVVVNFVFGVLAFATIYSIMGIPTQTGKVEITDIEPESPAERAGLQSGDVIISYQNESGDVVSVSENAPLISYISSHADTVVLLHILRDGAEQTIETTPQKETLEDGSEVVRVGVGLNDIEFKFYPWWQMPFRGIVIGVQDSVQLGVFILQALRDMVVQVFQQGTVPQDLSGPVGIVDQTYQSGMLQSGWLARLNWMGLISVNLAIMNLLPIPALDGGRALFLLLEPILGKDRRLRWEMWANTYGMFALLGLIILITAKDIWQIVLR